MGMSILRTVLSRTFSWKWEIANDWLGKSVTPFRYVDCASVVILYWNNSGLLILLKQSWDRCSSRYGSLWKAVNASQEQELQELFYWVEEADLSCCDSQVRLAIRYEDERCCDPSWKDEVHAYIGTHVYMWLCTYTYIYAYAYLPFLQCLDSEQGSSDSQIYSNWKRVKGKEGHFLISLDSFAPKIGTFQRSCPGCLLLLCHPVEENEKLYLNFFFSTFL